MKKAYSLLIIITLFISCSQSNTTESEKKNTHESAIEEILLIHIDMKKRKSCPMPDESFNKVLQMKEENDALGELDFDLRFKIKS